MTNLLWVSGGGFGKGYLQALVLLLLVADSRQTILLLTQDLFVFFAELTDSMKAEE